MSSRLFIVTMILDISEEVPLEKHRKEDIPCCSMDEVYDILSKVYGLPSYPIGPRTICRDISDESSYEVYTSDLKTLIRRICEKGMYLIIPEPDGSESLLKVESFLASHRLERT